VIVATPARSCPPRRLASVAPERSERKRSDGLESEIHTTCLEWAHWCRTRGRFGAPRQPGSVMEQLVRVPSTAGDERSARCDRTLALFNWCVIHHEDQIARRMFEAQFIMRGNVKRLALEAGISRAEWHLMVNSFARQVYARHLAL
jgi:hypothetical protein